MSETITLLNHCEQYFKTDFSFLNFFGKSGPILSTSKLNLSLIKNIAMYQGLNSSLVKTPQFFFWIFFPDLGIYYYLFITFIIFTLIPGNIFFLRGRIRNPRFLTWKSGFKTWTRPGSTYISIVWRLMKIPIQ